jgi:predicted RNA-binding Zn ribbon-like protein
MEAISAEALSVLNQEWQQAVGHRQLTSAATWIWDDASSLDRVLWPISSAAIDLLTSPLRDRIRTCESPTCDWLFIDSTKNGSRRFCRAGVCGNRTRVQRFRAEKRQQSS